VSRAMINRIERGLSSPTASVLGRLSGAFGLTISQLLDAVPVRSGVQESAGGDPTTASAEAIDGILWADGASTWTDPETGYERRPISSPAFPADVTAVALPVGAAVTYPASAYAFLRHCIWVTSGTLTLERAGEPVVLRVGDRIELGEPAEVTYRNDGVDPCEYVVVVVRV
jgi:transcriptional regulator with XRE-family HTH domain